jgi:excisionase family DNA binding protein
MANDGDPLLLTVPQAAELLQISPDLAYELIRQNRLPHVRLGAGDRVIRVPRFGLEAWIGREAGIAEPAAEPP